MIKNREDYFNYKAQDKIALGIKDEGLFINLLKPKPIWRFQKLMRKLEFYSNCKSGVLGKFMTYWLKYKYHNLGLKLGFSIPINVFGPGLVIVHYGTIVINPNTKVGKNCRIHACTNIGTSGGTAKAPSMGDNIYIGPGVKIFGDIRIADNIAISANSVVNKSFLKSDMVIGGVPAKELKSIDIRNLIKHIKT